jgi:gliding motility-associated-like protein
MNQKFTLLIFLLLHALISGNLYAECYDICSTNTDFTRTWCPDEAAIIGNKQPYTPILERPQYKGGELYLKIRTSSSIVINAPDEKYVAKSIVRHLQQQYGIKSIVPAFPRLKSMHQYYKLRFDKVDLTEQLIKDLQKIPAIQFAERVPQHYTFYTPNDIHPDQYNVILTQAQQAWDLTTGSSNIVIGMVDDAVLLTHEDLAANIWTNPGEIAGNGIDDDANGYIDDINGWDPASNDNDPNPEGAGNFSFSHGTHCAGIAASVTDNGIGVASVGFNASLMAVKTATDGSGSIAAGYEGIEYAIAAGADVISLSWGGGAEAATEQAVIDEAYNQGIVVVAAAGNDNTETPMFPASYNHVISVAAIDNSDTKADFTNFGATIDVCAPGVHIWSTVATTNSTYEFYDGTSMACPYVSGLAALMLAYDPTATVDRIEECLKTTADDVYAINPTFVGQLGAGRVNAFKAVQCTPSVPIANFNTSTDVACAGETFTFLDISSGTDLTNWYWSFPGGTPTSSTAQNPSVSYPASGTYNVTLIVVNALGSDTLTQTFTVAPPSATLSGDAAILAGYIVPLEVNFTGTPPFALIYTDGYAPTTISGITENPYYISVSPDTTTTYNLISVSNAFCSGTVSGSAEIFVIVPDPNDICSLGLPFPPLTIGVESCVTGNTGIAYGELPYIHQSECAGTTVPTPSNDLWYSFIAVANILDVNLEFEMDTAVISFYEGTCDGLIGRGCAISTDGTLNTTFSPVNPGDTYYIQVAGGSLTDDGDFTLCIENYGETIDEICALGQSVTVNPLPFFGTYLPNTTVEFCYTLEGYNQNSADWIHGIVPILGNGWDAASLTPTVTPPPCSFGNEWGWYASVQGESLYSQTVVGPQGPGFFLENPGPGFDPNDPGDNFGDAWIDGSGCTWTFCFEVTTVAACPPGSDGDDLSVLIKNFSDSETGAWGASDDTPTICTEDPEYLFKAVITCCPIPDLSGVAPTCSNPDNGSITATPTGGTAPFTFAWSTGFTETTNTTSTISNLTPGFYVVTVTDADQCSKEASYTLILDDEGFTVTAPDATVCSGDSVQLTLNSADAVEFLWSPGTGLSDRHIANPMASPSDTTSYIVVVTDATGCTAYTQMTVNVKPTTAVNAGTNKSICPGGSVALQAIGGIGGSYAWTPATGLSNANIANPTASPTETTQYVVAYTNANGCISRDTLKVFINPEPFFPDMAVDTTVCGIDTIEMKLSEEYPIAQYHYQWSPTTGLDDPTRPDATAIITDDITYTITVTNSMGCQTVRSVDISFASIDLNVDLGNDTIVCGNTFTIRPAASYESYTWSDGSTDSTLTVSESGEYILRVGNALGCGAADTILVTFGEAIPNISGDLEILQGESSILTVNPEFSSYLWSNSDTTQSIEAISSNTYSVTVTDEFGCQGTDSAVLVVLPRNDILIPTAFSPNNDNLNDVFAIIPTNAIKAFDIVVFNRWGNKIYSSSDINESWDGTYLDTDCETGVYVYSGSVTFMNDGVLEFKGNVSLVR